LPRLLDLVLQDRRRRPRLEDAIDLVTSGPEARGITNRDTRVSSASLFANAEVSVLIAGYAVYQGQQVFEALAQQMLNMPNLSVRMFLDIARVPRDSAPPANLSALRQQVPREAMARTIGFSPALLRSALRRVSAEKRISLHAKCIVVDNRAVFVSSANFTERGQQRNSKSVG